MKVICPISGVPFRTYDSLPISVAMKHPIFTLTFDQLAYLLDRIKQQEEDQIERLSTTQLDSENFNIPASLSKLTAQAVEAIHEKNWNNQAFKLYQTKHLTMLAFMNLADLLELENGYAARPNPQLIEAHFWTAIDLFAWACTIYNPQTANQLPHYRISKDTEDMGNFRDYLQILSEVKTSIGNRYRSRSDEIKIATLQRAVSIIASRQNIYKKKLADINNPVAAKWAILVTRPPADIREFWYAILASSSIKITFDGVKVADKWIPVTINDLKELRDWMEDNLLQPRGEAKQTNEDDSEYYFIARHTVLNIIRRHINIFEQGTASFNIVNTAMGAGILSANDDTLEKKAVLAGLPDRPKFQEYIENKVGFIRAMAKWRNETKTALVQIANAGQAVVNNTNNQGKDKKDTNYEIL